MTRFWREFMAYHFMRKHERGVSISTCIQGWRGQWVLFATKYLIPAQLFASPWGAFPSPELKYATSVKTHLRVTREGHEVKTKLLTHIPLYLSDEKVLKLLFEEIRRDFDSVVKWATWSAKDLWDRHLHRKQLSFNGTPQRIAANAKLKYFNENNSWVINSDMLRIAASNYEHDGFLSARDPEMRFRYPKPLSETSVALGLPITNSLLAHCLILVANHPEITTAFLEGLELYGKNGARVGFLEIDGRCQLIGYKHRRGPNSSQQIVNLTDTTAEIVRQVIALTKPLRKYLKDRNNPAWRFLLLTCGKGFMVPRPVRTLSSSTSDPSRCESLAVSLGNTSKLSLEERRDLVSRLSLASLRASAGVLVYLETKSTAKMAAALGHTEYQPKLLERYLPEPIASFFQERWVRIFQTGIIIEALKDSPYALEASGFTTMEQLHKFLNQHVLKISSSEDGESEGDEINGRTSREVIFGVNTTILTALLSLQLAVDEATTPVRAIATYWSIISRHLVKHIETVLPNRDDLQCYLREARLQASSVTMQSFVNE
jgi:hypothetical protein